MLDAYRLEYVVVGELKWPGTKPFEAASDEEANSKVEKICREVRTEMYDKGFQHITVRPSRLIKIHRPEVSTELKVYDGIH